ncbi:TPR domain/radical SAM/B12 binding domain protein [Candidatus Paraburkholderia calva]|nr:TPR domain/radical SAM/B12 binding domain protein [Candidatus Paraburkholderia calva]
MNMPTAPEHTHATHTLSAEQQFEADLANVLSVAVERHQALDLNEAETLYRVVLEAQPGHADANYNLGMIMAQRGQFDLTMPFFEAAIGANPARLVYWANYIDTLTRGGQVEAAKLVFDLACQQGLNGPAIDALAEQLREATELRQGVVAPNGRTAPTPQEVNQLLALFNTRRYDESVVLAQTLTQRFPKFELGLEIQGIALMQRMKLPEAIAALRRSLELRPSQNDVRRILAESLRLADRHIEAEAECRRVIGQDPHYSEAHRILALVLRSVQRMDEAQAAARRAVELAPSVPDTHDTLALMLMDLTLFDKPPIISVARSRYARTTSRRTRTCCSVFRTRRTSIRRSFTPDTFTSRNSAPNRCARRGESMSTKPIRTSGCGWASSRATSTVTR